MKGPCDLCGSSDGNHTYEDGHSYCFVCNTPTGAAMAPRDHTVPVRSSKMPKGSIDAISDRKIERATCSKFGVHVIYNEQGAITGHEYPWYDAQGELVGYKERVCATKDFYAPGGAPKDTMLFGQNKCSGRGKFITITEGELDCLSVSQMFDRKFDVVSVRNGAASSLRELKQHIEWLEGYDQIVLCFDNDPAGKEATKACQDLFTPNKVKVVNLSLKDPNEYLTKGSVKTFISEWWDAKTYTPVGIVKVSETWQQVLAYKNTKSIPYPWEGLNDKLLGLRKKEIVIFAADTGIGKSQAMREIQDNILNSTSDNVGCIMLEESVAKTTLGWMSFAAGRPLHKELDTITEDELAGYWAKVVRDDRYVLLDHQGWGQNMDTLKSRIRYMKRSMGCEWVVLDHLQMALTAIAGASGDWGGIDELMTDLVNLVHELDIGLIIVSHTSGERNLRGSKGIGKAADAVVFLERDKHEEDEALKDITTVVVDKNRWAGDVGTACYLKYSRATGRMTECPKPIGGQEANGEF